MVPGIVIGCYAIVWLFAARHLYGRWRASSIDRRRKGWPYTCQTTAAAIDDWNDMDRADVMIGALGVGLFWPLVILALPVIRFMDSAPQMSQAEMRDRLTERDRRIAELEREAGIRP